MRIILVLAASLALLSCESKLLTLDEVLSNPGLAVVDTLQPDTTLFNTAFELRIQQPVDHNNPEGPKFEQRVFLSYAGADKPVVLVTEGYGAGRNYTTELSGYLDANQIIAEHRFFGESVPDSIDWSYMNTFQAASDHHRIIELFSKAFSGKWVTTGISKGGQTVMFHSYYYPNDADIRVPYVAPLNFGPEDPRIFTFLDTVGSDFCRDRILSLQKHILKNRDIYFPMMLDMAEKRGYTFERIGGAGKAFEYAVLEYDFAYWQWGRTPCEDIVVEGDPEEVFNQFFRISSIDYFSDNGIIAYEPFFYQALTEIGYYGYDFDKFGDLLICAIENGQPEFAFSAPQNTDLVYDYQLMKRVDKYVRDADNFLYIYGMQDTWSATSVNLTDKSNSLKILKRGGDHTTRIGNLPDDQRNLVLSTLKRWIEE